MCAPNIPKLMATIQFKTAFETIVTSAKYMDFFCLVLTCSSPPSSSDNCLSSQLRTGHYSDSILICFPSSIKCRAEQELLLLHLLALRRLYSPFLHCRLLEHFCIKHLSSSTQKQFIDQELECRFANDGRDQILSFFLSVQSDNFVFQNWLQHEE